MRNLKLTLAYDGTDFNGWQVQPGFRTVQETLEKAVTALTGECIRVNASGRTDAGVHALGQVVNFYTNTRHSPEVLVRAINAYLPADVVVSEAADMPESFDANRDAKGKLYRYVIHDGRVPNLFQRRYCYHSSRRSTPTPCAGQPSHYAAGTISTASRPPGPTACRACARSRIWP